MRAPSLKVVTTVDHFSSEKKNTPCVIEQKVFIANSKIRTLSGAANTALSRPT